MNFLNMEYFLVIASEGSFNRAAEQLFVSQQSLSEHIKKLESELGTPLFHRGRTLSLTPAGERFLEGAAEIMHIRKQMLSDIARLGEAKRTKITIAISTFDTPPFLPELLHEFTLLHPQYEAVVVKRLASDIARNMHGVNLYFNLFPQDGELDHVYLIERDEYVAVVEHSLPERVYAGQWPSLEQRLLKTRDLSLINRLPFILLYDRNGALSLDLGQTFNRYGFFPGVGFQSDNNDLNTAMCTRGAGVLLTPLDFIRRKLQMYPETVRQSLRMYPVEVPGLKVALALSYKKGRTLSAAEKDFIKVTQSVLSRDPANVPQPPQ